jgi:predicted DCC family thiol-disulfide oxidoreductase YuxK
MEALIIFDGVCDFCNSYVNFVIHRDKEKVFKFTSSQSEVGQFLLQKYDIKDLSSQSILVIEESKVFSKSSAIIRILEGVNCSFIILPFFKDIPESIRDFMYDIISKIRYYIPSIKKSCRIPSKEERSRFLFKIEDYYE